VDFINLNATVHEGGLGTAGVTFFRENRSWDNEESLALSFITKEQGYYLLLSSQESAKPSGTVFFLRSTRCA
jgi:hypothetical protein